VGDDDVHYFVTTISQIPIHSTSFTRRAPLANVTMGRSLSVNGRRENSVQSDFSAARQTEFTVLCHVTSGREARKNHSRSEQSQSAAVLKPATCVDRHVNPTEWSGRGRFIQRSTGTKRKMTQYTAHAHRLTCLKQTTMKYFSSKQVVTVDLYCEWY